MCISPALLPDSSQINRSHKYQRNCFWGLGREMVFPAEMVSLNTQASEDRGAIADWGRTGSCGQKGCLHCLSTLPSLETNSECARDPQTQAVGGPPWSIYTSAAKAEGSAVRIGQFLLFPSLGSLGLAISARRGTGWGVPASPLSPSVPGILLQDLTPYEL